MGDKTAISQLIKSREKQLYIQLNYWGKFLQLARTAKDDITS